VVLADAERRPPRHSVTQTQCPEVRRRTSRSPRVLTDPNATITNPSATLFGATGPACTAPETSGDGSGASGTHPRRPYLPPRTSDSPREPQDPSPDGRAWSGKFTAVPRRAASASGTSAPTPETAVMARGSADRAPQLVQVMSRRAYASREHHSSTRDHLQPPAQISGTLENFSHLFGTPDATSGIRPCPRRRRSC